MLKIPFINNTWTSGDYKLRLNPNTLYENYEVYYKGHLVKNNLRYFEILGVYERILSGKGLPWEWVKDVR